MSLLLATNVLSAAQQAVPTKTLLQAAAQGDVEQLNLHIARGADLNGTDARSTTPLAVATQFGRLEAVTLLVDAGANINADTRYGPPLVIATMRKHPEIAELFLAKGADPNAADSGGRTPLLAAVETEQKNLVELFVAKGADVNAADDRGRTPMSAANGTRNPEIIEFLRQKGAQEPVSDYSRDPYGRAGGLAGESSRASRANAEPPDILEDPNAIRVKLAGFPDLPKALKAIDANCASEERSWASRRSDNRTTLIRAVARQFADEIAFLKTVAVAEKAEKTIAAIDELAAKRTQRYDVISSGLREERRLALQEAREAPARGRGRTSTRGTRGRTSRGAVQGSNEADMSAAGPYANARAPRGRARPETAAEEVVYDADTESQLQAWLGANPQDKRDLLTDVHELDLFELDTLRQTALEEEAAKTTAALEGLMLARQGRLERITAKMAADDERLAPTAGPGGMPLGPTRGRRGQSTIQQPQGQPTTTTRRGRRGR